jgi:TonB-linked SusC/RagA family outer membrane protein
MEKFCKKLFYGSGHKIKPSHLKRLVGIVIMSILLFSGGLPAFALQTRVITGLVMDMDGTPLPGATVVLKGTTNGTVTDGDGNFRLSVPDSPGTLVVSFIGYHTREIVLEAKASYTIILEYSDTKLNEVVLTALGYKVKKDETATTSSKVGGEEIANSGEAMILNSIGSRASNVQIARSNGDPGAGTTIRIRGANTISGSSNPLIILDGVPISNSTLYGGGNNISGGRDAGTSQQSRLNDINPNDIESVEILKGASAAALWGSRAANGVLVITTKNGKPGKLKISFKSTLSIDQVNKRYPLQTTYGQGRGGKYSPTRAESWGDYIPDRAGGEDDVDKSGQYFEALDGTKYYPIDTKNSQETFVESNWNDIFQTGGFWQNDLSFSGGTDKSQYFFSIGNINQDGIIRASSYDRTNVRLNVKFFPNRWFNAVTKAGYINSNSNRIQQSSNVTGVLLGLLRTPPDFDNHDYYGTYYDNHGVAYPDHHRGFRRYLGNSVPTYNNPLWTIYQQKATSNVDRFIISQELNITPVKGFRITLRGGVDRSGDHRVYFFPVNSAGSRKVGILAEDMINEQELNFDAFGVGNFNISEDFSLMATLGWNINDRFRTYNSGRITGFLTNSRKETTDLNTAAESSEFSNYKRNIRSNRGYYSFTFNLFQQLFLTASGGLEAASSVKGSFFYPAFDAAWQFSDLGLTSDFFSFGKLRASWGKVGVQPAPYRFETTVEGGFSYSTYSDPLDINLFGGGFRLNDDLGNPNIKPEMKTEWEIGTDLRFFNDALSLTATYYQNHIDDILIAVGLTPSSGYDTQYMNAAAMKNHGFEAELDWSILKNRDFRLTLLGIFATNKNEVTDLHGTETITLAPGSVDSRAIVGYPLGVLYGTGSQTDENGNYILDANGFPQITSTPIVLGDPNPDWTGSLGLNADWKGFSFRMLFGHSNGGDFSPRTLWVLRRFGTVEETANRITTTQELVNYHGDVIPEGTTVRGNIADFGGGPVLLDETWYRTGIGGGFGDNQAYNFSIYDATWTRLKELTLSYTFNSSKFRQKTKLGSIMLSASGRNLVLWDNIPGVDPEINQSGVSNGYGLDYFTNPSTRSILFTLAITY